MQRKIFLISICFLLFQVSYGRFAKKTRVECELDLFITQADGKKVVDPSKLNALCSCIQIEVCRPLRVALMNRGPDTELLVANLTELSGKGRPLVFYDITLALKMLNIGIFSVPPDFQLFITNIVDVTSYGMSLVLDTVAIHLSI